jgi:hypothetical protein
MTKTFSALRSCAARVKLKEPVIVVNASITSTLLCAIAGSSSMTTGIGGPFRESSAVSRPRFITLDGKRYLWRDLVTLYRAQAKPTAPQPTLFAMHDDRRPPSERNAAGRYREPIVTISAAFANF